MGTLKMTRGTSILPAMATVWATLGVVACVDNGADEPVCGDDERNGDEVCDGSAMGSATCAANGFHSGPISCTASCTVDTSACLPLDADQDGLNYDDELAAGTDPDVADTDGDGVSDGDEVGGGSNPLEIYSWPSGVWPDRAFAAQEAGLTPNGSWDVDGIPNNLSFTDQFGETFDLHQFYGYVVVVSVGAVWCGPCNVAAQEAEAIFVKEVADGVIFLEVLIDGQQPGVAATQQDVDAWTSKYGLSFPVTRADDVWNAAAVPTFYFLDRTLKVQRKMEGYSALGVTVNLSYTKSQ